MNAPKILKVAAISSTESHRWKVLVEMDRDTLEALDRKAGLTYHTPPNPGTVLDFAPTLDRLQNLEARERDAKNLGDLLAKLQPKPEPETPAE